MDTSSLRSLSSILNRKKPITEAIPVAIGSGPPSGYTVHKEDQEGRGEEQSSAHLESHIEEAAEIKNVSTTIANPEELRPPTPESIEHTGLSVKLIEQLIIKSIYYHGDMLGRELSSELGLQFSVIEHIIDALKRNHYVLVKSSLGVGTISSRLELSDAGRELAREYIDSNAYSGKAPVPLYQYVDIVGRQKAREAWLTMDMLKDCYKHMVVTDQILGQIGPAVNAGKSFLIYGMPGNGKTYLAEALHHLDKTMIYIPYAIEHQGLIIQMFDPLYHTPEEAPSDAASNSSISDAGAHDRRWFRSRRPFIVSGGELTLETLDLSFNAVAKTYDAPLHMKANNGIYLIDDFGRQKVTPAEVLNRWIIPMERRVDFLTFQNGTKIHVPFEVFLVFSTNLKPEGLGDEAFLRRIQYKMLMKSPDEYEFASIFKKYAESQGLTSTPKMIVDFLEKNYRKTKKPRRRCHPRDVLTHAIDIIRFERREWELTPEVLDHAFHSCFVSVDEDA